MIGAIRGQVLHVAGEVVTVDVHGVGYEVWASAGARRGCLVGGEISFIVHTEVQESLIRLYGFEDQLEKQVFLLLTRVKGVGARSASDIISKIDKVELLKMIAAGDLLGLQRVKGIGKKTAERIIVELKEKVGEYVAENNLVDGGGRAATGSAIAEALEALLALGFPRNEAEHALDKVRRDGTALSEAGEIIRQALRYF